MAKEAFIGNLQTAYIFAKPPVVDTDSPFLSPTEAQRILRQADVWLTPKSVEGFDPRDFEELGPTRLKELRAAIETFRALAQEVPPNAPATKEQSRRAWARFLKIRELIREPIVSTWVREAGRLVDEAETWCREREWPAKIRQKKVQEEFLGEYDAPQLSFHTLDNPYLLTPVTPLVSGASGLLDLEVLPSGEFVPVAQVKGKWYVRPISGQGRGREWSERAFVDAVNQLSRYA